MSWPTGFSWTKTSYDNGIRLQGGPFFYHRGKYIEFYAGFRPTLPWLSGGNEGLIVAFKRLMQRLGMSNLGFALRRAKGVVSEPSSPKDSSSDSK